MNLLDQLVVSALPFIPKPIVGYFSKPYIAGPSIQDAIRVVRELNKQGAMATLDVLGESVTSREQATAAAQTYEEVLGTIDREKLDSNISVKLTQLGLKIEEEFCYQNTRRVVEKAASLGNFVRIDMEDSSCTTDTIAIYKRLREDFDNVGLALQAYLRRSIKDVRDLLPLKPNIRICKGIYVEPREIAYKDREIINRNFTLLVETLLRQGSYVAIATHDERLVWEGYRLIDELNLASEDYEFQMLLGVDEQLRRIILGDDHRLRVYVPFGKEWYAYSVRRLRENPRIAGYVFRAIFKPRH